MSCRVVAAAELLKVGRRRKIGRIAETVPEIKQHRHIGTDSGRMQKKVMGRFV